MTADAPRYVAAPSSAILASVSGRMISADRYPASATLQSAHEDAERYGWRVWRCVEDGRWWIVLAEVVP